MTFLIFFRNSTLTKFEVTSQHSTKTCYFYQIHPKIWTCNMNEIDKWHLATCIHLFPADLTASPKGSLSDQQWYTRLVGTCRGKGFRGWFSRKTCKLPYFHPLIDEYIYIFTYIYILIDVYKQNMHRYLFTCPSFNSVYGSNLLKLPGTRRQMAPRVPALPKVRRELHTDCTYTMKRDKGMYILQKKTYWLEELAEGFPKKHHHLTRSMAK